MKTKDSLYLAAFDRKSCVYSKKTEHAHDFACAKRQKSITVDMCAYYN